MIIFLILKLNGYFCTVINVCKARAGCLAVAGLAALAMQQAACKWQIMPGG